jgi:hypothetical protein
MVPGEAKQRLRAFSGYPLQRFLGFAEAVLPLTLSVGHHMIWTT